MEIILCWWNVETDIMELSKNDSAEIVKFLRYHSNERTLDWGKVLGWSWRWSFGYGWKEGWEQH